MSKLDLPVPSHFDAKRVNELFHVKYEDIFTRAKEWSKRYNLHPAAKDVFRICLMAIDCQNTFCLPYPDGELSVVGADKDTVRLCEFIYKNVDIITNICLTMDTHLSKQIFHRDFWVNDEGSHPDPSTLISLEDVQKGVWKVNPVMASVLNVSYTALHKFVHHYARTLASEGKYALLIWPHHGMLGGVGHAIVSLLEEAVFFHDIARGSQTDFQIKGGNPLTENYSVLRPEVLTNAKGVAIAQKNTKFIEKLLNFDAVVIAGQAKSHCVAWTIDDLLNEINTKDPKLVKKVYLLEDCSSPVVIPGMDFTQQANEAFERFQKAGMNVVKSTDPITTWDGINL